MDPRMMKQAMKKLGIKQEDVDALEVVIKCPDKTIIVSNPSVQQVEMGGQVTFQVAGTISEEERSSAPEISEEDVSTVVEQTSCTKEEARETLEKHSGDLAAAILELQEQ
ncbi:MAG: nascent polypeptide-associated complex subunit alpha [archaeon GW2011_AR4]|nr:MAG: nascent polypeptide-associated complex subunit alpha [archaeon GW2011_AR4]